MLLRCFFIGIQRVRRHRLNEPAVLHTLETNQPVGKLLNLGGLAMNDQHLKTGFVIQVRMAGGNHQVMEGVLQIGEFFSDAVGMMIVDEGNRADDGDVGSARLLANQTISNEVAECLGAVGVSGVPDRTVKPIQKVRINSNSDAAQYTHACPHPVQEPDQD